MLVRLFDTILRVIGRLMSDVSDCRRQALKSTLVIPVIPRLFCRCGDLPRGLRLIVQTARLIFIVPLVAIICPGTVVAQNTNSLRCVVRRTVRQAVARRNNADSTGTGWQEEAQ
jgi:hypothetical protein